jgi:hypothetical protein
MSSAADILTELDLGAFSPAFAEAGFKSESDLAEMTLEEARACCANLGLKQGGDVLTMFAWLSGAQRNTYIYLI